LHDIGLSRSILTIFQLNDMPCVIFKSDGTIELGPGYTPTTAGDAFLECLGPRLRAMYRTEAEAARGHTSMA
jgi:hypothetical protein